jgi:hypothetical protein
MIEEPTKSSSSQMEISSICDEVKNLLLQKNMKYGDSALNPIRVFSKSSPLEQLRVRMDDKLSRIRNQDPNEDEDPVLDLIGYLILFRVAYLREQRNTLPMI